MKNKKKKKKEKTNVFLNEERWIPPKTISENLQNW